MFSIEVNDNINKIIQNVDATKAKVELATIRALNKTVLWIKSQAIREISKEKQIQQKLIRKRLKVIKTNKSSIRALVTVGLYWIRAARLGSMRQMKTGAKAGKHEFKGAFIATMPRGYTGIFRRKESTALPIEEVSVDPNAAIIVKKLINDEVEKVFEKFFQRELNYILKV
jgi:hypothetical protein